MGNISVPAYPIEAYVEEMLEQKHILEQYFKLAI